MKTELRDLPPRESLSPNRPLNGDKDSSTISRPGTAGNYRLATCLKVCLPLSLSGLLACQASPAAPTATPLSPCEVKVVEPRVHTQGSSVKLTGTTVAFRRSSPAVRIMAKVVKVAFEEGETVPEGRTLIRLDTSDLKAKRRLVESQQAAATTSEQIASKGLKRAKSLYDSDSIARSQLESAELGQAQAQAAAKAAAATIDELDSNLAFGIVRSPFSGKITQKLTEVGNLSVPGQPLFILEDQSQLRVTVPIPSLLAAGLSPNNKILVEIGDSMVQGTIEAIVSSGPIASAGSRLQVLIDNQQGEFIPGQYARILVPQLSQKSLSWQLPEQAVRRRGQLAAVFTKEAGKARLRYVQLGAQREQGRQLEILSGLEAGDRVLLPSSASCLMDGRAIKEVTDD